MKQPIALIPTGKPFQGLKLAGLPGTRLAWHAIAALWLAAAVALVYPTTTHAATTYAWSLNGNGTWSTGANWTGGVPADGAGNTANFGAINITASRTVTLDSARTLGTIQFGDTSGSDNWTLTTANGSVLTMDNLGGAIPKVRALQNTATISVVLAGTAGIQAPFSQDQTVVLNAANTYTGDTEVSRGFLRIGVLNAIPTGVGYGNVMMRANVGNPGNFARLDLNTFSPTINGLNSDFDPVANPNYPNPPLVNSSGAAGTSTLTVGNADANGEFGGVITNGASRILALTKMGLGTQSLTNANTYTGATIINGGTLKLRFGGSIAKSASITVSPGATFDVGEVTTPPYSVITGKTLNGSGGTGTINGSLSLDSGASLTLSYVSGTPTITVPSGTLTLNDNTTTITVNGSPLSSGVNYKLISVSGTGAVAGGTGGALTVGGLGIVGGGTPALAITGSELWLNIGAGAPVLEWGPANGTWAVGTTGWGSGGSTAWANGDAALLSDTYSTGTPTIGLNTEVLPQSVVMSSAKSYTITGVGDIGGASEVRVLGPGALTLDVNNQHTGGTTLVGGTLNLKKDAALGDVSSTFTINGGTLDNTKGSAMTTPSCPQAWNGNFVFTGSSDLDLGTGAVTLGGTRTVTVNGSKLTVGGDISGTGFGMIKAGAGTLALGGNNTFTGGLNINLGEVIVNNAGALNAATPNVITFASDVNTKTLSLNGNSLTVANLRGGLAATGFAATQVRNNHASTPATLQISVPSGTSQFIGLVADGSTAPLSVTKIGSGIWMFGGGGSLSSGTYSGDTTISGGTLRTASNSLLPNGAGKGNLINNATLDMYDRNVSINGLSGNGTVTATANSIGNNLTVGGNDASGSFSGVIQNGSSVSPFVNLTKIGAGTQTLSGACTYTGPTTVNGGTLLVDSPGSLAAGSAVTVNAGGTLGGSNGVISGSVTIAAGGTISAGDSPGLLTLAGGLKLSDGGTNLWELAALKDNSDGTPGTDFDQLVLTGGTLTLGGSSKLSIKFTGTATAPNGSDPFWQIPHSWTIISASGAASNFAQILNSVYAPVGYFTTSVDPSGIILNYTPGVLLNPVTSLSITNGPGSNLSLNYSGGAGSQFVLVQTNDVTAALSLWTRIKTNASSPGTFIVTPSDPQQFYRVKSE